MVVLDEEHLVDLVLWWWVVFVLLWEAPQDHQGGG
jgi:hypothetical protein